MKPRVEDVAAWNEHWARTVDWHLRRFSRPLLDSVQPPSLRLLAPRAIPFRLAPLRWVYLLQRDG